jgi:hypothetical protein
MGYYFCEDCGEQFLTADIRASRIQAIIHAIQTWHETFSLDGTDLKMIVKV